jgi:hypothetical protein
MIHILYLSFNFFVAKVNKVGIILDKCEPKLHCTDEF